LQSKADRIAAEEDRYVLADMSSVGHDCDAIMDERIATAVERIQAASGRDQADQARRRDNDTHDD
jgi:hypothetical protein